MPGVSTGVITGAPLPDGLYNIIDLNWGARGPYKGGAEVDSTLATPLHLVGFLPFRLLDGHPFFETASIWAQVGVGNGWGKTKVNLRGFASQRLAGGLAWTLGQGFSASVRTGLWIPVNSEVSLRDFWVSQTNVAVAYVNSGWALNADFGYGGGKNGARQNVAPANAAFSQPATAGTAYGVVNLTAEKHIEKWAIGAVGFGSEDMSSPYRAYLKQRQFALGGLVGYDFGSVQANVKLTRDVYQQNEGGYETRLWMTLLTPLWVFEQPKLAEAKY
jgi:hypothetical protein